MTVPALTVGSVMTRCPVSVSAGAPFATVAAILARRRIGAVPVVDRDGRLIGVLSRRDLLTTYVLDDDAIRADVERELAAVLPDRPRPAVSVHDGVVLLLGRVEWRSTRAVVAARVRAVPGVVGVTDRLGYVFDDGARPRLADATR